METSPRRCALSANTEVSDLTKLVQVALEEMKAVDVVCLDVRQMTDFSDYIFIATGTSNRHVRSLASSVAETAKAAGHTAVGVEGTDTGEWVLVDLGGVVVNLMQAATRAYYDLERLWTTPPAQRAINAQAGSASPVEHAAVLQSAK